MNTLLILLFVAVSVGLFAAYWFLLRQPSAPVRQLAQEDASFRRRQGLQFLFLTIGAPVVIALLIKWLPSFWLEWWPDFCQLWVAILLALGMTIGLVIYLLKQGVYTVAPSHRSVTTLVDSPRRESGADEGWGGSRKFFAWPWEKVIAMVKMTEETTEITIKGFQVKGLPYDVKVQVKYRVFDLFIYAVVNIRRQGDECPPNMDKAFWRFCQKVEGMVTQLMTDLGLDGIDLMKSVIGDIKIPADIDPTDDMAVAQVHHHVVRPLRPANGNVPSEQEVVDLVLQRIRELVREAGADTGIALGEIEVEHCNCTDTEALATLKAHELRHRTRETMVETAIGERARSEAAAAGRVNLANANREVVRALPPQVRAVGGDFLANVNTEDPPQNQGGGGNQGGGNAGGGGRP